MKELMVVHRDSPIGKEHTHFYSVSSVKRLTEKLVNKINELEKRLSYKIETKYNIGDEVWVIYHNEPTMGVVGRIDTTHIGSFSQINYYLKFGFDQKEPVIIKECFLFPTKEELLKS